MGSIRVLIDIGSTFTKATAVDLGSASIVCTARAPTTVDRDVTLGLRSALECIEREAGVSFSPSDVVACSSAAGGLRLVSVGLVPELSSEAARRAALGAGAKLVGHYSYTLSSTEVREIEQTTPDILLLAGGTDGGNEKTILHNARALAASNLKARVVVAGNKCARDGVEAAFAGSGVSAVFVDNVMPAIGTLEVQPCREAIRELFLHHIVRAKGLDRAREQVSGIIMPTPAAVLEAAVLLSRGAEDDPGFGDLVVVDVGGATTDVYSIAEGAPTLSGVGLRGLPEPYAKRTVEGDLGVRRNIDILAELGAARRVPLDPEVIARFHADPTLVPANGREAEVDCALARLAVEASFERHVGRIDVQYGPHGAYRLQTGKDLTAVRHVIGTGGPVIHAARPYDVLRGVLASPDRGDLLKPEAATLYLDAPYILYAVGLLAQDAPGPAIRLARRYLRSLGTTFDMARRIVRKFQSAGGAKKTP